MANESKAPDAPAIKTEQITGSVFVACKLPHGLVFDELPSERKVKLAGWYQAIGDQHIVTPEGAGITEVSADVWAEIMTVWGEHPAIKNGLIFAIKSEVDVKKEARSRKSVKSGMEQSDKKPGELMTKE